MKRMKLWVELLCGVGLIFTLGCHSIKLDEPVVKSYQAARKIQYRSRQGADIWQTPKETAASQKGNCVDKAVFLNDLLQKEGYDSKLAFGIVRRAEGPAGHAWVVLEEKTILDPTDGWVVQSDNWVYLENRFPVNEFNESYLMARIEKGD
jgi:transglutaminase superfamily protein